jgi:hypothetical protein
MAKVKSVKIPTLEEIEANKNNFAETLQEITKEEKEGKNSPKRTFLKNISDNIKEAIQNGTSFVGIKTAIKKVYGVDVSTQIIADFAHNELGIQKKKRGKKGTSTEGVTGKVFSSDKTSAQIKAESARKNKNNKENSL